MESKKEQTVITLWSILTFIVVSNASIFNTALPAVMLQWSLRAFEASWLVIVYSVIFAVSTVIFSRLSDRFTIRKLLCIGLSLCGTASIFGFFSPGFVNLIAVRMVQAMGAASVSSLSYVYFSRHIHPGRKSSAMLQLASAIASAFGLGPILGAFMTQYWGWPYIFLVPCTLLLAIPAVVLLFEDSATEVTKIGLLWQNKRRQYEPFIKLQLFGGLPYTLRVTMQFSVFFVQMSVLYLLPILFGISFKYSPLTIGLLLCPGAVFSSWFVLRLRKSKRQVPSRYLIVYGLLLMMIGETALSFGWYWPYFLTITGYLVLTTGFAMAMAGLNDQVSETLNAYDMGSGIGLSQLMQFIGGAVGVSVCGIALDSFRTPGSLVYFTLFLSMTGLTALHLLIYVYFERKERRLPGEINLR
jgi:DHA2 family metal-tetracycline-proton antiporter-like MFS transporter